jgi:NAD(P)H-nitrite reductase large subunit
MTGSTKGALLQRDGKRYAVVTRMPAGIVTPDDLEKIAGIGRKYRVPMLKITSGQRFALIGHEPGDVADGFQELGPLAQPESAPCVKFVQACLGTEMCRYGNQDSIGLARALEERFRDQTFPAKIKIGVSGCQRCCGESQIRDLGIMGTNRGWTVFFGGNAGRKARIGDIVASDLTAAEVMDCAGRLLEYYQRNAHAKERTARFMERIGMETLKSELLTLLPYIQIEKVS